MRKQKLSLHARKRKAARDLAYAKGLEWEGKPTARFKRKEKKAENQRIGQNSNSDIHHVNGEVGNTKRVSVASNRDTWKNGDRKKKKNNNN